MAAAPDSFVYFRVFACRIAKFLQYCAEWMGSYLRSIVFFHDFSDVYFLLGGGRAAPQMASQNVAPPGEGPLDPYKKEIDPVAFALDRVQTMLVWIDEHRASFEAARASDPETAERELANLADATRQAREYHGRLVELVLAGYAVDRSKRLPRGLQRHA
jgi:hypothetical protein